jgi:quinol monooxygenase YgiN
MALEVCTFEAKDSDAQAFVDAMNAGGSAALGAAEGCRKVTALAGVENPGTAILLVEWDSVEAHEAAKASDTFKTFAGIIGPFIGGAPSVLHYR